MQVTKKDGHVSIILSRHDTDTLHKGDKEFMVNLLDLARSYLLDAKSVLVTTSKNGESYTFLYFTDDSFQC